MPQKPDQKIATSDNTRAEMLIIAGLVVCGLIIYVQTAWFDFINIDDHSYVYKNSNVLAGLSGDSIKWAFTAFHSFNWHPVTWLSHMADISMFGLKPGAFHAMNTFLHLLNSVLAFIVFRAFTGDLWKSAAVAFIFAVHPTHVESVAWISERKDVLSTTFWLLTMLAYLRFAKSEKPKIFSRSYLLVVVLFAIGLMAKPMLVTLPFALLLLDLWPLDRLTKLREALPLFFEKLPLILLAALSSVLTMTAQSGARSSLALVPIDLRLSNSVLAYAKYIGAFFYPADLAVFYPIKFIFESWQIFLSVIILITISVACWLYRKEKKYLLVGWLWFLGTLVPVIGLVQVGSQSMADRYTYVPYFGLSIMVVWGASEIAQRFAIPAKVLAALSALALVILTTLAFWQTSYWRNNETLFKHSIAVTENNSFLKNSLCMHYTNMMTIVEAEKKCSELLDNVRDLADAQVTLGVVRYQAGKVEQSTANFLNAIKSRPNQAAPHYHLAAAYFSLGKIDDSLRSLERAIAIPDGSVSATDLAGGCELLGNELLKRNDRTRARALFEQALKFDPNRAEAKRRLAELAGS